MKEVKIEIADKEYKVLIAETEEERIQGLGNVESMDDDEGMLFIMPEDQGQVVFNTEEMEFDIDLVFINQDDEVYNVVLGKAHSSEPIISTPESEEGIYKMYILGSDGKPQMDLVGGERIFSRKNSRTLIKLAKKANKSKADSDYAKLGKKIFKYINEQDNRPSEFIESPK